MYLVSVPHRYGCLSGSHTIAAGDEVAAGLQALRSELQAHKAELYLAAGTDDVLAACLVMLHLLTTGGTGPDRGAVGDPLHLREISGLAGPQEFEVLVDAAIVVAAIRAWSYTFPRLQTLPTELVHFLFVSRAHRALHTEVSWLLSLYVSFATRT